MNYQTSKSIRNMIFDFFRSKRNSNFQLNFAFVANNLMSLTAITK